MPTKISDFKHLCPSCGTLMLVEGLCEACVALNALREKRVLLRYAQEYLQHVRVGNHRDLWVAAENRVKRELDALWEEQQGRSE